MHLDAEASSNRASSLSQACQVIVPSSNLIYDFRAGVREPGKEALLTGLDQDSSGDYELSDHTSNSATVRQARARKAGQHRVSRAKQPNGYSAPSPGTPSKKSRSANREHGKHDELETPISSKLSFNPSSEAKIDQLKNTDKRENNYSAELEDTSSPYQRLPDGNADSLLTQSITFTRARYPLRKRRQDLPKVTDEASMSFHEISHDHPSAQGCKACYEIALPCSLLENGSNYPCRFCIDDGEDCEPIIEPPQKQPCERCKRLRLLCSFKIEPGRKGPCSECAASSTSCVAGPLRQRTVAGPPTRDLPQIPTPAEPRRSGRRISQPQSTGGPTYYSRKLVQEMGETRRPVQQAIPPKIALPPIIRTMITCFAHPIRFNYESTMPKERIVCHWCQDMRYGLKGLGPVEVEVMDNRDGHGYKELDEGHTSAGHEPSRMCTSCTTARLIIAACKVHEIEPIPSVNPESYVFSSFVHYLIPGMTESAPFEWCSICPKPASYRCCKRQEPHMPLKGRPEALMRTVRCGLLLCQHCARLLVEEHFGLLDQLIDSLRYEEPPFDFRADADFLHPKGELLRRFC